MRTKYKHGRVFTPDQIKANTGELVSRSRLAQTLGMTHNTVRDIYTEAGYPTNLNFIDYYTRYRRQSVATRVIEAPVKACWRQQPLITDFDPDVSEFEKMVSDYLVKSKKLFHVLSRADKLAGIGSYAVLVLGFNDGGDLSEPVKKRDGMKLNFIRPISQQNAAIDQTNQDSTSERFLLPELYSIAVGANINGLKPAETVKVHWSRVIHLCEGLLEGDIEGTPRLMSVYNDLIDLEKISAGSGEMFWRGAIPGYLASIDSDTDIATLNTEAMKDEIEKFEHKLQRWLKLQGVNVEQLSPNISDPTPHQKVCIARISASTGIPVRLLTGSERGELASSQDDTNWNSRVDERRTSYVEPYILRPTIDRLIDFGVLPEPVEGEEDVSEDTYPYAVEWPPVSSPDPKEVNETIKTKTEAITAYGDSMGAETVLPLKFFLTDILGLSEDKLIEVMDEIDNMEDEEDLEIEEGNHIIEEEEEEE